MQKKNEKKMFYVRVCMMRTKTKAKKNYKENFMLCMNEKNGKVVGE